MKWWHWMIVFLLVCIAIYWVWYCYRANLLEVCDTERGTNGDMFGGLTALFSGFAFAGIILTIVMQSQELKLQRDEMTETRDVFVRQTFDNTFFQLLRTQQSIVSDLRTYKYVPSATQVANGYVPGTEEVEFLGRSCFKKIYEHFLAKSNHIIPVNTYSKEQELADYQATFQPYQSELGHYFRHLYHIIKFIDSSSIKDKKKYTNIVRAQLSSFELGLLFYNGLMLFSEVEINKFKPLIEKYMLLKNIDKSLIVNDEQATKYDQMKAFGRIIYENP